MKKLTGFTLVCISLCLVGATIAMAAGQLKSPTSVFQQKRSDKEDVIYFRNKDVLRGQVMNESISVTTPYGPVRVPLRKCAGVSFEGSRANTEALVTVNFNLFTGIISDRSIRFKIGSSGAEIKLRKEKIRYVLLKQTKTKTSFVDLETKTNLFVMTNGDLLTGKPESPQLTITTDYADVPVAFSEIESVQMQGGDNITAIVKKKNGDTMRGTLKTEEITIKLDIGVVVDAIYKDKFSNIYVDNGNHKAATSFGVMQPIAGESQGALSFVDGDMALIPEGEFLMGSNDGGDDEKPVHKVYLDAFYISKYEVTVGQYKKFVKATGWSAPDWSDVSRYSPTDKHPMVYVSWDDAAAYCKWAGGRLPTEAEWEKAARGGLAGKKYPLGDSISHNDANYGGTGGKDVWECCAPVGSFAPNGYGLYDMAGNVWEWCADWFDEDYYANSPSRNPKGPSSGISHVLRGGSWHYFVRLLRAAYRRNNTYSYTSYNTGFRFVVVSQD